MTAKELLKYKWHQFVIVSELLWLRSEKNNKQVIVDLQNWMTFTIITLSLLTLYIHSSSFAVSVHTL